MRRLYQRISVFKCLVVSFFLFQFFLRRGLPLACSKVCLDASVDNVQSRAHELYGIIWLCSWSTFLFCRICLGRRCLHNLVGFSFFIVFFSSPGTSITHDQMPVTGRTASKEREKKKRPSLFESEQFKDGVYSRVSRQFFLQGLIKTTQSFV